MEFFRRQGQRYVAVLDEIESLVLSTFVAQMRSVVLGDLPSDWVEHEPLRRVFPPASLDDPMLATEFAELTSQTLQQSKAERLAALARFLADGQVDLDLGQARAAVAAFNDARLITAALIGEDRAGQAFDQPNQLINSEQAVYEQTYRLLSALQSSLVDALMEE
ncbi:MAG: DUF2017 family protein [Bifidobacteriaceae bacterium]|nr:DUF2017 family protein [Bifidobacteriaceae bacterium]